MKNFCYMCERTESSREHAPPKCFFPEHKDSPDGKNYRKDLITVPSCDEHNSAKSKDDEYLMMVITSYFNNNQAASAQIEGKITRAWARSPGLPATVVKNLQQVTTAHGVQHAYEVDTPRFDQALACIAHALYFHNFAKSALIPFKAISYPLVQLKGEHADDVNSGRACIIGMADQMFRDSVRHGANPEIFWYQILPVDVEQCVIRMCFFEAFQVVAMSSATLEA